MSPSSALRDEANERISAVLQELIIQRHISVQSGIALDPEKLIRVHPEFGEMDIFEILQNLEQAGTIIISNHPSDGPSDEHGVVTPIGVYLLEADAETLAHAYDLINPGRTAQESSPRPEEAHGENSGSTVPGSAGAGEVPVCFVENGSGMLRFGASGEAVKLGGAGFRAYRLLDFLLSRPGAFTAIEAVFHVMVPDPQRHHEDERYRTPATRMSFMRDRIDWTIKELQKGGKLRGRIKFEWSDDERSIAAVVSD